MKKLAKDHAELENDMRRVSKERDESYKAWDTDLKNHNKREMTLVDEIAKKNRTIEYYKDQERIRTDQLRATESKVEELYKQIEGLTNNCRSKSTEIARLAKEMSDIKHELNKEDDHGRTGFKRYIEYLIEEEEGKVADRFKERLNEEITAIFEKEEETEVKGVGRTSSGRYPWGAKIEYKPSEIDNFTDFLKEEVDKKRIVDISYGVEDDIHVTRELFTTAVKLIVARGYHEFDGVVTGYGRFHVLTTPDVEFKELYDTWKIKSIGPDIPCGSDSIE